MFQSDDEITFDADFLSDAFDLASTPTSVDCPKRHSEANEPQLVKRIRSSSPDTLDILSLLKSNVENRVEKSPEHRFTRPVLPCKKRRVVQRKFPGPAGILPAQRDVNIDVKHLENIAASRNGEQSDSDEMVCSQQSDDVFTRPAWRRMLQDLESVPGDAAPGVGLPERYTIAWAKARAARRQLDGGRTPFLAAVVQQIDCSTRNPMALLKDQTGEIQATLIHEVWEEYGEQLHAGVVILLRQVGVISTAKQHYLAITLNNLFAIYADEASGTTPAAHSPAVPKTNYMTSRDFIKTLADIRDADKMAAKSRDNSLKQPPSNCETRRDTQVRSNTHGQLINSAELFPTAEVSYKHPRSDSETRRDTQVRSNTHGRPINSLELLSTTEVSFKQPRSDSQPRRDTPARSNTHSRATNAPGLLSTTEVSFKQPRSDCQTRRDTQVRSNTHSRATNALGLFSSAEHTSKQSNMAKFTTDSHANSITSETPTFLRPDFDKTTDKSSKLSAESEMLSQVLDGLDAESIFDDF